MMLGDPQVQQATGESTAEAVMAKLREMKNNMYFTSLSSSGGLNL